MILATPPHFRPVQLKAAIEAGKHVFMEKPVAVDVPGVKTVMAAGQLAKQKGLGIAAGTQRRHQKCYQETIKRMRDGAIGEIVYARCYWNGGEIWVVEPRAGLERHGVAAPQLELLHLAVRRSHRGAARSQPRRHELGAGAHPVRAVSGLGGRQVRTGKEYGHIFDHFAVEFEYPNGVRMFSQCRQINGCDGKVEEAVVGANGTSNCAEHHPAEDGRGLAFPRQRSPSPYRQEHEDLIASIRAGNPINEAQAVAESTMTGDHRPRGGVQRQGRRVGRGHEIDQAARAGEVRVRPLSDARGRHARSVSVPRGLGTGGSD